MTNTVACCCGGH